MFMPVPNDWTSEVLQVFACIGNLNVLNIVDSLVLYCGEGFGGLLWKSLRSALQFFVPCFAGCLVCLVGPAVFLCASVLCVHASQHHKQNHIYSYTSAYIYIYILVHIYRRHIAIRPALCLHFVPVFVIFECSQDRTHGGFYCCKRKSLM